MEAGQEPSCAACSSERQERGSGREEEHWLAGVREAERTGEVRVVSGLGLDPGPVGKGVRVGRPADVTNDRRAPVQVGDADDESAPHPCQCRPTRSRRSDRRPERESRDDTLALPRRSSRARRMLGREELTRTAPLDEDERCRRRRPDCCLRPWTRQSSPGSRDLAQGAWSTMRRTSGSSGPSGEPVSATRGSSPNSGGSSSYTTALACSWIAAARRRARRSQPRTVAGGRPSRAAIMRCPWPTAASSNAAMITSVPSRRRGTDDAVSSTCVFAHGWQTARRGRSGRRSRAPAVDSRSCESSWSSRGVRGD